MKGKKKQVALLLSLIMLMTTVCGCADKATSAEMPVYETEETFVIGNWECHLMQIPVIWSMLTIRITVTWKNGQR